MDVQDTHYSVVIQWDLRDNIYVATVPDLEGCSAQGTSYEEALREALDAIDTWMIGENPATLPAPHFFPAVSKVS